ncbi:hypothetical protein QBC32DRAFT_94473 [Pseudoneurospora amorphoporcata]|uniref:DUF7582 domain-containing protein n=1 Tax=Pseudoneurospora amorphoporcata TaxID=241081 RepID=A0AAN6SI27_9PEZI|nr:hypothetical protein QBC32DRAFT_94473 [Pseudoneurospora amorphoporcata]
MSSSLPLKTRISPPLGAGPSLAEGGDHLPGNLTSALEYASKRLQRKGAKFTLLVIRKDYQLPTSPLGSPSAQSFSCGSTPSSSTSNSVASTPAKPTFAHAFKQFVRGDTGPIKERVININTDYRYGATSPTFSEASLTSASTASTVDSIFTNHRGRVGGAGRWPLSPGASQAPSVPLTPATPYSTSSMAADINTTCLPSAGLHATRGFGPALLQVPSSPTSSDFGIRLIHAIPLKEKEDKLLSSTLEKAAKKFNISPSSLPPPIPASTLGLPPELLHRSLAQNEVLFGPSSSSSGAAGLRLLSLDHLYTFRSALQCYTRTVNHKPSVSRSIAHRRLEDAVDELRRLVLGNGCQKLKKSCLVGAYARFMDPVSNRSLEEVGRMYGRAYARRDYSGGRDVREKGWVDDTVEKVQGVEDGVFELVGDFEMPEPVRVMKKEKPLPVAPVSNGWVGPYYYGGDEKAVVVAEEDIDLDEMADMMDEIDLESKLEMDDIEAWYRNVQIGVGQIGVGREVRMVNINGAQKYRRVQPSRVAAPIPTVDIDIDDDNNDRTPTREVERIVIHEMQELHRTTPRLSPAPPGRSARPNMFTGLKLQTTFDPKPPKSSNKKISPRQHLAPPSPARQSDLELTTPIRVQRTLAKMELELVIPASKPKRGGFIYNNLPPLEKSPKSQTSAPSAPSTVQGAQSPSSDFDSPSTVINNPTTTQSPSSDSPSSSSSSEEEEHTARPLDSPRTALTATKINIWLQPPHSSGNTLDEILHNGNSSSKNLASSDVENESDSDNERLEVSPGGGRYNRFGNRLGPLTPNGYDDISPVTRGEWGFLMGVGGAGGVGGLARRAGVEAL